MASSDDEGEPVLSSVSEYYFLDDKSPISFSELAVQWDDGEMTDGKKEQIFLYGDADNGLQKICKPVKAWKFDLSNLKPEISVLLSKENIWIKLQKPRKSHENVFRKILITLQFLHYLRKNPEASGRALCEHLSKFFRFEPRPSEKDLVYHANFISQAVKKDGVLATAKIVATLLDKDPRKWSFFDKDVETSTSTKSAFIVDDVLTDDSEDDGSDDEEQGDKVCAICDNGGDILCCEGKCLRSFHATEEAGSDSHCETLGFYDEQVEAMQNFYCENCLLKQHQCFACGKLGSSDDKSSAIEVFRCVSGECGRFYHPCCVSKLLHPGSESEAKELEKKIVNGASFTCPFHKCCVCRKTETEGHPDLRFAMCRRCPKSYHRKCLPSEIAFDDSEDEDVIPRAWEDLMPKKRILIYCLAHEIDDTLCTPLRNHIKFPGEAKRKQPKEEWSSKERVELKKRSLVLEDASTKKTFKKPTVGRDKVSIFAKQGDSLKRSGGKLTGLESSKKQKVTDISGKPFSRKPLEVKSTRDKSKPSLGAMLYEICYQEPERVTSNNSAAADVENDQARTAKSVAMEASSLPPLDAESEKRLLALMKDATSDVTLAEINQKHELPSTYANSSRYVDRTITLGKVEASVEALREAVQKLEEGCSTEDAAAVCGPGLLSKMMKWKNKLRIYLAPFIHGMRYSSYGRHFTMKDKLLKVVDMLHLYAQDGDTIVDFCCGSNDFSWFMKKKLDDVGKKCSYKNYDVISPKNDFNFEKRDWMSVKPNELPPGSQLIMGLNPPFGAKAKLANMFINKALEFKPKLIVLIVPQETERLDKKDPPYDLVFEDNQLLAGKSFYLPGSVDVYDKQMDQWCLIPPPLSFWSHKDWTAKFKAIAQKHGHLYGGREISHMVDNHKVHIHKLPSKDNMSSSETSMLLDAHTLVDEKPEQVQERATSITESHKKGFSPDFGGSQFNENSNKKRHGQGERRRELGDVSLVDNQIKRELGGEVLLEDKQRRKGVGDMSPEDKLTKRGSAEILQYKKIKRGSSEILQEVKQRRRGSHEISPEETLNSNSLPRQFQPVETSSLAGVQEESIQQSDGRVSGRQQFGAGYVGLQEAKQNSRNSLPHQFQNVESLSHAGVRDETYQQFDSRLSGQQPYGAGYERRREDDSARRFDGAIHWETPNPGLVYRNRISEEQFPGYQRENMDSRGYVSYIDNPSSQRSSYLFGHDSRISTPYSVPDFSNNRMGTSTMERYAPRLDELNPSPMERYAPRLDELNPSPMERYAPRLDESNHSRMSNLGSELPFPAGTGVYDHLASRPLHQGGYAPGQYHRQ